MKASEKNPTLREQIASFCRARGIEALYVFGSRAGGVRDAVAGGRAFGAGQTGAGRLPGMLENRALLGEHSPGDTVSITRKAGVR